jgi:hypothetical protein
MAATMSLKFAKGCWQQLALALILFAKAGPPRAILTTKEVPKLGIQTLVWDVGLRRGLYRIARIYVRANQERNWG